MGPTAALLPCGQRLHLQHGPIDLIIGADGDRQAAFAAAAGRFETILNELVSDLPLLRSPDAKPHEARHDISRDMICAIDPFRAPFRTALFVTPMICVAGMVAQTVLAAMCSQARPRRAYVNNGGDIALHLGPGARFDLGMAAHDGASLGCVSLTSAHRVGGIATSGRHGRSHSLGIADSVTVLARTAAMADIAATLIANAVDLPAHKGITRVPANVLSPDSDLGRRPVVTACADLSQSERQDALASGLRAARSHVARGLIVGASLHLQGETRVVGTLPLTKETGVPAHA